MGGSELFTRKDLKLEKIVHLYFTCNCFKMIVFTSIDVNYASIGILLDNIYFNYNGIISFTSVQINFCARKNLWVGGWGPGNPYSVRIVKIVRFIGRSIQKFCIQNAHKRFFLNLT